MFDLYDDYAHSRINRRDFMQQLLVYAVGGLTVASLLSFVMPDYKVNLQTKADDPRITSQYVHYQSEKGGGKIKALLTMPADAKKRLGGIVVVHENQGLNPYIEDVARRAALAGFVSIAPDALTPLGGYPGNDDEGRTMQSKRDRNEMLEEFRSGKDGALGSMLKHFLEAALDAEMDLYLNAEQRQQGNRRNGKVSKQVRTSDSVIEVESSRDRSASFEPQIIKKRETVLAENLEPRILKHVRFRHESQGHLGPPEGDVRHAHLPRHARNSH